MGNRKYLNTNPIPKIIQNNPLGVPLSGSKRKLQAKLAPQSNKKVALTDCGILVLLMRLVAVNVVFRAPSPGSSVFF